MKKSILPALVAIAGLLGTLPTSSAQTATFSYNDGDGIGNAGSYAPGSSFTFAINLLFVPGGTITNLQGFSYWFEQSNASGPFNFSITQRDVSGSQFTDPQTPGLTYPQTLMPQSTKDLGALLPTTPGLGAGTYFVANITMSIAASTTPGTYTLRNVTTGGKTAVITDDQGRTFAIPQANYTLTVVPEPTSIALFGFGLLGVVAIARRRRISAS